jgi:hypothetical protein
MTDKQFEEFLQKTAAEYRSPPATPREEMWSAIEAARAKRRGERDLERAARPWLSWGLAAAAVLAVGVGVGRMTAPGVSDTPTAASADAPGDDAGDETNLMFRFAAADYLARTDAFLSLFRAEARIGQADAEVMSWARDLLATARLMMDSPIASDPHLRELLEDLELILVQIGQYASNQTADELDLIEQGLEEGGVQHRLQAALTADAQLIFAEGAL